MAVIATPSETVWRDDSRIRDLSYRRDIDGLRAIAVLPVVIYHAFPAVLRGGFIGVDVFFVISGFLISSIIFAENARGKFSYRTFYARRIRRIVPALALVLVASLATGWIVLFPHEFAALGETTAGGAAFFSNFVLYGQSGYFKIAAEVNPLLHLWSLGIEEQFYIVWPFLLTTIAVRPKNALLVCLLLLLASFLLNVHVTRINASEAFYFPFTRWWELMAGAALGWCNVFGPPTLPGRAFREIAAAAGLSLIIGGAIGINRSVEFPGWWALIPVAGASLLIASEGAWLNRKFLASGPLVAIGLISYPLYLWHWPMLAFARASVTGGLPTLVIAGLLVFSFVLATLTYLWVERPIRFGKHRTAIVAVLSTSLAIIGISGSVIFCNGGFPARASSDLGAIVAGQILEKSYNYTAWRYGVCYLDDSRSDWKFANECYGSGQRPLLLLWGSSVAASLYPGLVGPLKDAGYGLAQFTAQDCNPTLESPLVRNDNRYCLDINRYVVDKVVPMLKPQIVVLHTVWRMKQNTDFVDHAVEALRKGGAHRIVILGSEPWWEPRNGLPEVYVDYARKHADEPLLPERTTFELAPEDMSEEQATREKAKALGVGYVSMWNVLCNQQGCLTRLGPSLERDMPTYDQAHLTPRAAGFVMRAIIDQLLDDRASMGRN